MKIIRLLTRKKDDTFIALRKKGANFLIVNALFLPTFINKKNYLHGRCF